MRSELELNQNCVRRYSEIQFHFEHTSVSEHYPSLPTSVRISLSTTELAYLRAYEPAYCYGTVLE